MLDRLSAFERAGYGDFVGVFEIGAHRQAFGQAGHPDGGIFELASEVHGGRFPFEVWVGGDNYFLDFWRWTFDPVDELFDGQLVGGHVFDGVQYSAEYVVDTMEFSGFFDCQYVRRSGHHAKSTLIPRLVGAQRAGICSRDVIATLAGNDGFFQLSHRFGQAGAEFTIVFEQVEHNPLG